MRLNYMQAHVRKVITMYENEKRLWVRKITIWPLRSNHIFKASLVDKMKDKYTIPYELR
jgi:hypothetical protein